MFGYHLAAISGNMDAMSAVARKRIHVTETPRLELIINRNAVPGEPKAATLVRLAERGDAAAGIDGDLIVFHTGGPSINGATANDILDQFDADLECELN